MTRPLKPAQQRYSCDDFRRGVATLWIVGFGPALLALLVLVTEISSLWLARIELETAVESGALACVKVWGDLPDTSLSDRTTAEAAGVSFAQANTVLGNTFTIAPGSVTFGSYASGTFTAAGPTIPNDGTRACVVYATADVPGLWNGLGGAPRSIQARATARYDSSMSTPRLVRVTTYLP